MSEINTSALNYLTNSQNLTELKDRLDKGMVKGTVKKNGRTFIKIEGTRQLELDGNTRTVNIKGEVSLDAIINHMTNLVTKTRHPNIDSSFTKSKVQDGRDLIDRLSNIEKKSNKNKFFRLFQDNVRVKNRLSYITDELNEKEKVIKRYS